MKNFKVSTNQIRLNLAKSRLLPYLVLIVSLILGGLLWNRAVLELEKKKKTLLKNTSKRACSSIDKMITSFIDSHIAGAGLVLAKLEKKQGLSKLEWRKFVETIDLESKFPGMIGIGLADYVSFEEKDRYFSNIKIHPPGQRKDYLVVRYVEPEESNQRTIGFDMGYESKRRHALEKAKETGLPQITSKITLLQGDGKTSGFLFFIPFFENGISKRTKLNEKERFIGWIYSIVQNREFINGIIEKDLEDISENIFLEIYNAKKESEKDLIYRTKENQKAKSSYSYSKIIDLYGEKWFIKTTALKSLFEPLNEEYPNIILIAAIILSFMIFLLLQSNLKANNRAVNLADEISYELDERTKDLKTTNTELGHFIELSTHDLREPTRIICSYAEILRSKFEKKGYLQDPKDKKYFNYLIDNSRRMKKMVTDLLDYSRIEKATQDSELYFEQIINEVKRLLKKEIRESKAEILVENKTPKIIGSKSEFILLFKNLIENSIKFRKKGEEAVIKISSEITKDKQLLFCIEDNGIGIEPDYLEQVFELFERIDLKIERYSSTGMGLALAKKIVEKHNGKIWVESSFGEWTKFYFTIGEEHYESSEDITS